MRGWVCWLLVPATMLLALLSYRDWRRNDGAFAKMVMLGVLGGLAAALAYDVFRIPFVYSESWNLSRIVPPMNLFKVFPQMGAIILRQPSDLGTYSVPAHFVGWTYHFSNAATFGVMYVAMVGNPSRHHWAWALAMAAGLEIGMLVSPYPAVFGLEITLMFLIVTLTAHVIFGTTLGILCRRWGQRLGSKLGDIARS